MNAKRIKRVALYVRVSTDHQSVKNQEIELQVVAERHGWQVLNVYRDQGVSGTKGRDKEAEAWTSCCRPSLAKRSIWSRPGAVDRLGRSLIDLVGILQELHAKHVDLYLHLQGIDTTTPSGRAMFQMMGVFAEFERSMIHERVMVGLARAEGPRERNLADRQRWRVMQPWSKPLARAARGAGKSIRTIAREQGVGVGTVARLTG